VVRTVCRQERLPAEVEDECEDQSQEAVNTYVVPVTASSDYDENIQASLKPTGVSGVAFTLRYDMVYLHALKSWCYGQLNLAHGTETKNKEKTE